MAPGQVAYLLRCNLIVNPYPRACKRRKQAQLIFTGVRYPYLLLLVSIRIPSGEELCSAEAYACWRYAADTAIYVRTWTKIQIKAVSHSCSRSCCACRLRAARAFSAITRLRCSWVTAPRPAARLASCSALICASLSCRAKRESACLSVSPSVSCTCANAQQVAGTACGTALTMSSMLMLSSRVMRAFHFTNLGVIFGLSAQSKHAALRQKQVQIYSRSFCETCGRTSDLDGDLSAWLRSLAAWLVVP